MDALEAELGEPITNEGLQVSAKARITLLMGNVLLDFDHDEAASFYVASVVHGSRPREKARVCGPMQLIAGLRTALSPNIDAGLKYRYIQTPKASMTRHSL